MTKQQIDIIRISPSTLDELRLRAGSNHLDTVIADALDAYDQTKAKTDFVLPDDAVAPEPKQEPIAADEVKAEPEATSAPETDVLSDMMPDAGENPPVVEPDAIEPAETVEDTVAGDDQPEIAPDSFVPSKNASVGQSHRPETVITPPLDGPALTADTDTATDSYADDTQADAEPTGETLPVVEESAPDASTPTEPSADDADTGGDEAGHGEVSEATVHVVAEEPGKTEPKADPAPASTANEAAVPDRWDCIDLPRNAGNDDLAYTTLDCAIIDGVVIKPSAWFNMLGAVVVRLQKVLGLSVEKLVDLVNSPDKSNFGIRCRVGDVRVKGFQPVPGAGFSIRKVSSGKTWAAIVKIATAHDISVEIRLTWQTDKPSKHPGANGRLLISRKK